MEEIQQANSSNDTLRGKRTSPETDEVKTTGRWKKWEHQRFLEGICFLLGYSFKIVWKTLEIG